MLEERNEKKKEKEKEARWQSFEKVTSYHDISKKQPPINNCFIHLAWSDHHDVAVLLIKPKCCGRQAISHQVHPQKLDLLKRNPNSTYIMVHKIQAAVGPH
jgi:hypothetical protein